LNAGAYSYGVANLKPLHILIGPKGPDAIETLRLANELTLAIPSRDQIDEKMKHELRERLTILFHKIAWAHRDLAKWNEVRAFLQTFQEPSRNHHSSTAHYEKWLIEKFRRNHGFTK
jgi:hypothetical protein